MEHQYMLSSLNLDKRLCDTVTFEEFDNLRGDRVYDFVQSFSKEQMQHWLNIIDPV